MAPLIPGELLPEPGELELNAGRPVTTLSVSNSGDRPVQVAPISISPKPTPPCSSTGSQPAVNGSTSPPAPPSASNPATAAT